jgi:pimeloyl-ACP methyl ester carboxylesterase
MKQGLCPIAKKGCVTRLQLENETWRYKLTAHGAVSTCFSRRPYDWSSTMAPVIMGNPDRPELSEELENSFCRTHPEIAKHFAFTFLADNRSDLAGVRTPCLIIQCASDAIAPRAVGEFVHARIPGSRLAVLSAVRHCPHLSAPQSTITAIRSFLETLPG